MLNSKPVFRLQGTPTRMTITFYRALLFVLGIPRCNPLYQLPDPLYDFRSELVLFLHLAIQKHDPASSSPHVEDSDLVTFQLKQRTAEMSGTRRTQMIPLLPHRESSFQ